MHLGNRGVAFVYEQQKIAGKVIEQRGRGLAGQAAGKVPRIIFNPVAIAHGLDHLEVEPRPLVNALRLDHPALRLELRHPLAQLFNNRVNGRTPALGLHHVVALGIDGQPRVFLLDGSKQRIDLRKRFNLVAEQLDPVSHLVVGREDFDHVAAHPEGPAPEVRVIALVENLNQPPRNVLAADALAFFQQQEHPVVSLRRTKPVNAAHRTHNDCVAALKQAARGREPQLVELLVDRGFLLDVEVPGGNVGFGLVVVVITYKIFDRIAGKELLELVVKLGGQGFIVRQDQRRAVGLLNDLGHGEGLARPGHAQQHLVAFPGRKPLH